MNRDKQLARNLKRYGDEVNPVSYERGWRQLDELEKQNWWQQQNQDDEFINEQVGEQ